MDHKQKRFEHLKSSRSGKSFLLSYATKSTYLYHKKKLLFTGPQLHQNYQKTYYLAASNIQICIALVLPGSAFHYKVGHLPPTTGISSFRPFILHTSQVREQLTGKTQIPAIHR
jgi:hypothetical protein